MNDISTIDNEITILHDVYKFKTSDLGSLLKKNRN